MALIDRYRDLQKTVDKVVGQVSTEKSFEDLSAEVLTRVVIEHLKLYTQRVNVGIEDSLAASLDDFKRKVTDAIFNVSNKWKVNAREPVIFPPNCRFLYTRGRITVAVIEQSPQIRSLLFESRMTGERLGYGGEHCRLALALPYVLFVVVFRDDQAQKERFTNLYAAWRNAPIMTMEDQISFCLLPNYHENLSVCTGAMGEIGGSLAQKVDKVIAHYWSSLFTSDLADYWWGKKDIDRRLSTGMRWQTASEENPLFILEPSLPVYGSLKRLLDVITSSEETPDESRVRHELTAGIDGCVSTLSSKILNYMKRLPQERHYPKDVKSSLALAMKSCSTELLDMVTILQHETEKLGTAFAEITGKQYTWEKRGSFWES